MKMPTVDRHFGTINNGKSFEEACHFITNSSEKIYKTYSGKVFTAKVKVASKGPNINKPVIIFYSNGKEFARAYKCCWGHVTNCNRTYIQFYTKAL